MPRKAEWVVCAWCRMPFATRSKGKTCKRSCTGHYTAMRRSEASYKAAGRAGGTRSGQNRRRVVVEQFLTCVQGPMRAFGTSLYLLGFMHGQNTAAIRLRKKARHG